MEQGFADGDTRILTQDDPRVDLTVGDVQSLENYMIANQPTIGDKTGAAFTGFNSVKIVKKTKIYVDLN